LRNYGNEEWGEGRGGGRGNESLLAIPLFEMWII